MANTNDYSTQSTVPGPWSSIKNWNLKHKLTAHITPDVRKSYRLCSHKPGEMKWGNVYGPPSELTRGGKRPTHRDKTPCVTRTFTRLTTAIWICVASLRVFGERRLRVKFCKADSHQLPERPRPRLYSTVRAAAENNGGFSQRTARFRLFGSECSVHFWQLCPNVDGHRI